MAERLKKLKVVTSDTLIPVGTVCLVLYYIGSWVVHNEARARAGQQAFNDHLASDQEHDKEFLSALKTESELLGSIDRRLSVIEGEMKRIRR
jgi:hypothetical protein